MLPASPLNNPRCDLRVLVIYRFYLGDYVTEKFYRALMNDIVPVLFGGTDYTQ
jgi:alpha-1,3-fucosyltransferase